MAGLTQEPVPAVEEITQPPIREIGRGPGHKPTGKSSNPEYETAQLLLKKSTKKAVRRVLEDQDSEMDLSDLVEKLLKKWVENA